MNLRLKSAILLATCLAASPLMAQRPLGVDVSSYQGTPNWTSVKGAGVVFAYAKATEGTSIKDADFVYNQNNGKSAGVYMGAYHFAHPNSASPGNEASYFWSTASPYIKADGKTMMPTLDFEVFSGVVGAGSYSEWANDWCSTIQADANSASVAVKPVIYVSSCNACDFNSSVSSWNSWLANYNGENIYTGTPWSACTSCEVWGANVWAMWQGSDSGSISGIGGSVDLDTFNGNTSSLVSALVATTTSCQNYSYVQGAIKAKYDALGDCNSFLGYPTTTEQPTSDGGGRFNQFSQDGAIYWTSTNGAWSIHGNILNHYVSLGSEKSALGYPISDETGTPDGIGRFNHFSNDGSIYWTANTGAWSIHGAIQDHYASLGWEKSVLGYPTTDQTACSDGVGQYNQFSNDGTIYWTPSTGAWFIHGNILNHYVSLGSEKSVLGYPVSDQNGTPDGVGSYNVFSLDGAIYYSPSSGAYSLHGAIYDFWANQGYEKSSLGYPTSDEYAVTGGRRNNFQHGTITYNSTTHVVTSP